MKLRQNACRCLVKTLPELVSTSRPSFSTVRTPSDDQARLLVVVQHGVHVFDPDGVDRTVEYHPLKVRHFLSGARTDQVGQNSVLEIGWRGVERYHHR